MSEEETTEDDREDVRYPTPEKMEIESEHQMLPSKDLAARVLQAFARGGAARHDTAALLQCMAATENVLTQTEAEEAKWEPQVVAKEWRECKMLGDIPVDLIAYEEALLRHQMQLDNIQAGNVSQATRATVRAMRREAIRRIQQNLDRIDECKQWWHQHSQLEAASGLEAEPIVVA